MIFIAGCNARCPYCQALHLVVGSERIPSIPLESILDALEEHRGFVKGVTITGGEVTLHRDLAAQLLGPLRAMGFSVRIDTYGAMPDRVDRWIEAGYVQCLAVDVKGPWSRYPELLGRQMAADDVEAIRTWVGKRVACQERTPAEFRTTVHPSLLSVHEIFETAEQISGAETYVLQNYRPVPGFDMSLQETSTYSAATLSEIARTIERRGCVRRCFVRGAETGQLMAESSNAYPH